MKIYSKNSIYVSAFAKLPTDMPSGGVYKAVDIGLIINTETKVIEEISFTLLTEEAKGFLKQLAEGYCLENGIDELVDIIKKRYFGASQKAICVTLKLAYEKFIQIVEAENK